MKFGETKNVSMYYRSFIILFFLIFHVIGVYAQENSIWSLQRCIDVALDKNPIIHRARLQIKTNHLDYKQAWQSQLPSLNATLSHGLSQGRTIDPTTNLFIDQTIASGSQSLSTNLILFDGLRMLHKVRMQANAVKVAKLEYDGQINELKLDVIEAYIALLTAEDLLSQVEEQVKVIKEQVRRAEVMHQEGSFSPGDYHDLKGQYSQDLNTIESAKKEVHSRRMRLVSLLNITMEDLGEVEKLSVGTYAQVEDQRDLYQAAKDHLPAYRAWEWRKKQTEQDVKVARSYYFPTLSIGAGLNSGYSNSNPLGYSQQMKNNLGKYLSLNLQIPIFNGFQVRKQVEQAKINMEDVKWQEQIALNALRENTEKAVFDLRLTQKNIINLQEQVRSYQESFRIAEVQFDLGASNSLTFLMAKNKWDNAQNQLVIKQYEWLLQKYINDYYAGKLDL